MLQGLKRATPLLLLVSTPALADHAKPLNASQGFFFGMIAVLVLTNFVQAVIERDKKYAYYGSFVLLLGAACLLWLSHASTYLPLLTIAATCAHSEFSRHYFHCSKHFPRADRYWLLQSAIGLILIPLALIVGAPLNANIAGSYAGIYALSSFALACYTAVYGMNRSRSYILNRLISAPVVLILTAASLGWGSVSGTLQQLALSALAFDAMLTTYTLVQRQVKALNRRLQDHYNTSAEHHLRRKQSANLKQISDDIRTPISGILGISELLLDTPLSRSQRDQVQTIHRAGDGLLRWLNGVSDWNALQAGKLSFKTVPFDFTHTLRATCESFAELASERQAELDCVFDERLPNLVKGDPERLKQVLRGLFEFALHYSEQGQLNFCATLTGAKNRWLLDLTDSQSGLRPEELHTLEHSFQQNASVDIPAAQRSWMLATRLAQMMDGKLTVEFERGGTAGSVRYRCELLLPRHVLLSHNEASYDQLLRGKRLLVVDDSPSSRKLVAKRAERWQMRVSQAPSGDVALSLLRTVAGLGRQFDLIILDHEMPGMSGLELAEAICRDHSLGQPALVMLSGASTAPDKDTAAAVGIRRVLSKPVQSETLKITLAEELTLGRVRARVSLPTPTENLVLV